MKVGIVGPLELITRIKTLIRNEYRDIEPVNLVYNIYTETPGLLKYKQRDFDAILFAGNIPFVLAKKELTPVIPWESIPGHGSFILRALLEASISGVNILNLSFDSYNESFLYEVYEEIGISKEKLNIFIAEDKVFDKNCLEYIYKFHKENYLNHKVSCCIPAIVSVYERLLKEDIPCFYPMPTRNIIRDTIRRLQLKHMLQISSQSQIVAISIKIDSPHDYSVLTENEYQFSIDKTKITEQVYLFAEKIQAAVIETDHRDYLLFSTRKLLEIEMHNYQKIELLPLIYSKTLRTVSIGIGYGRTAKEAKKNAIFGAYKANKQGGNMAYVVYEMKKIVGPISGAIDNEIIEDEYKVDSYFLSISEKTGISIDTVFKLYCIIEQQKQDCFTPNELAGLFGITSRSMNRIIEKLEMSGFCKIVGKTTVSESGRPSRIVKLLLKD